MRFQPSSLVLLLFLLALKTASRTVLLRIDLFQTKKFSLLRLIRYKEKQTGNEIEVFLRVTCVIFTSALNDEEQESLKELDISESYAVGALLGVTNIQNGSYPDVVSYQVGPNNVINPQA